MEQLLRAYLLMEEMLRVELVQEGLIPAQVFWVSTQASVFAAPLVQVPARD